MCLRIVYSTIHNFTSSYPSNYRHTYLGYAINMALTPHRYPSSCKNDTRDVALCAKRTAKEPLTNNYTQKQTFTQHNLSRLSFTPPESNARSYARQHRLKLKRCNVCFALKGKLLNRICNLF